LTLVKDEHRSLAAVVHAMQFLAKRMAQGDPPNQTLLAAIAHYLTQFPERLHHPAEDRYLFAPIRARTQEASDVLDALQAEHARGDERAARLSMALNEVAAKAPGAIERFSRAVEEYASFYWSHMMTEETLILPLAERVLEDQDWVAAAEGFAANHDPLFGGDTAHEFDALFRRIVYLAPPPIGFGGHE
jgi:hemerythrin-like domain-containing protein